MKRMTSTMTKHLTIATIAVLAQLTARAQPLPCPCDCNNDGGVSVNEVIIAVNIALNRVGTSSCSAADSDADGRVAIGEIIAGVNAALRGCDTAVPATPTPIPMDETPPTERGALEAWLQNGSYLGWTTESGPHPSGGPHFGNVRTFVNSSLLASLQAGNSQHPRGAAAVKELYQNGTQVQGWAVSVKVEDDSDGGNGWYWYEGLGNSVFASGTGVTGCTGCHSSNYRTFTPKDYILIPFPLN